MSDLESRDIGCLKRTTKRYAELAAMLKEKFKGSSREFDKIVARFALQEGLTLKKALMGAEILINAGIIQWSKGQKRWKYNSKEEWELFSINI
jgi:hypothetical protein